MDPAPTPTSAKRPRKRRHKSGPKVEGPTGPSAETDKAVLNRPTPLTPHKPPPRAPNKAKEPPQSSVPRAAVPAVQKPPAGPSATSKKKGKQVKKPTEIDESLQKYEEDFINAWNDGVDVQDAEALVDALAASIHNSFHDMETKYDSDDYDLYTAEFDRIMAIDNVAEKVKKRGLEVSGCKTGESGKWKTQPPPGIASSSAEALTEHGPKAKPCGHQEEWELRLPGQGRGKKGWIPYSGNNPCFFTVYPHRCRKCGLSHPPCEEELVDLARVLTVC